jgi:hypothetical protein
MNHSFRASCLFLLYHSRSKRKTWTQGWFIKSRNFHFWLSIQVGPQCLVLLVATHRSAHSVGYLHVRLWQLCEQFLWFGCVVRGSRPGEILALIVGQERRSDALGRCIPLEGIIIVGLLFLHPRTFGETLYPMRQHARVVLLCCMSPRESSSTFRWL